MARQAGSCVGPRFNDGKGRPPEERMLSAFRKSDQHMVGSPCREAVTPLFPIAACGSVHFSIGL